MCIKTRPSRRMTSRTRIMIVMSLYYIMCMLIYMQIPLHIYIHIHIHIHIDMGTTGCSAFLQQPENHDGICFATLLTSPLS